MRYSYRGILTFLLISEAYSRNTEKKAHYSEIFIRTAHFKCSKLQTKEISSRMADKGEWPTSYIRNLARIKTRRRENGGDITEVQTKCSQVARHLVCE